ncbi:serine/threonine-protein kinase [Myceligenerans pegani]|uniref:non-specific serine/threonine protein kinase n=1 Tax=Myceligenerans pegani TaxID=2776917 RepID=A0ABR9N466_9MICO|nr:serine/threonine-protein kinase [Myceligenerans sp. TRM 65318]MBE1877868.1 protein kinase [Myceligenerans sp. TRM 65318]MBE3020139.1 protein kinase [Myceligenerans sp. TRM 65318]
MRPVEGVLVGGRYRLVRRLAIGGMGEVWVAFDEKLTREVAIKVLREEYTGNEDFLRRLRTEARNSSTLLHPNIAQMYDYGEEEGAGYLVMELVLGEPLADLLEREPVLPAQRLLPLLAQTARGLHAAHAAGVVHRDVKPGNILLEHSGTVKITDFGVSVAQNQVPMTATGMVMGTAQYLSPEQAVGQSATGASDIYALGVVAYEASAGRRPFTGKSPVDIAIAHVNAPVPPLPSSVHPGMSELIMQMLEKDPAHRFASAETLAREMDALAEEISADPFGTRRVAGPRSGEQPDAGPSRHVSGGRRGSRPVVRSRSEARRAAQAEARAHAPGPHGAAQPAPSHGQFTATATPQSAPAVAPEVQNPWGAGPSPWGPTTAGPGAQPRPHQHGAPASGTPEYETPDGYHPPGHDAGVGPQGRSVGRHGTSIEDFHPTTGYVPTSISPPDGASRSYPSRRDVRAERSSRSSRRGGMAAGIAHWAAELEDRLGIRVPWPLVALGALLGAVVLVLVLTTGGDEGGEAQPLGDSSYGTTDAMLSPGTTAPAADSGMMLLDEPLTASRPAESSKDV